MDKFTYGYNFVIGQWIVGPRNEDGTISASVLNESFDAAELAEARALELNELEARQAGPEVGGDA